MARVRVELLERRPGLHQLVDRIALEYGPLAGAKHADGRRALLLQDALPTAGPSRRKPRSPRDPAGTHHPSRRRPSFIRISGVREPIRAVHDLGQEVALDAVEPAVDLRLHVPVGRDNLAVLDADHHAAAGAAEAAWGLGPLELGCPGPRSSSVLWRANRFPATAAAAATACALMKERREKTAASERLVRDIGSLLASLMGIGMLVDKRGGEHARQFADCSHAFDDLVIIRGLKRDHHLARRRFQREFRRRAFRSEPREPRQVHQAAHAQPSSRDAMPLWQSMQVFSPVSNCA